MRTSILMKLALAVMAFLALSAMVFIALISNPFNWFTQKSTRFSREHFEAVYAGMRKKDLVELLGQPLWIREHLRSDKDCERCATYCFMGSPPEWLPGFQEAWVYVDGDGIVRDKIWHTEP